MERITDYASLVTAINELVNLEIGPSVDGFIQMVEQEINRRLESPWSELVEVFAVTQSGLLFDTDYRGILRVTLNSRPLERLHIDTARTQYGSTQQEPRAYAVTGSPTTQSGQQHVTFWPIPPENASYTATIASQIVIPELTAAAPQNWVLRVAPDAYLYGAASHAVVFNGDETLLATYQAMFDRALIAVVDEAKRYQSVQRTVSAPGAGGYELGLP